MARRRSPTTFNLISSISRSARGDASPCLPTRFAFNRPATPWDATGDMTMKRLILAAGLAALLPLGACAGEYAATGGGYPVAYAGGPAPVAYDGFYDDYYGPFYDGYWGGDGGFYYSDGPGHPFRRGDGAHFRHDAATGFHAVRGGGHGGGSHGGGAAGGDRPR